MTNTGQPERVQSFSEILGGIDDDWPSAPAVQAPVVSGKGAAMAEAIRKRGTDTQVHHENTKEIETLETIPPDLLEALRDLMGAMPGFSNRLNALEAHADASKELAAALAGLQQINKMFGRMNAATDGRVDRVEGTLAEMKTMMEPLAAFLDTLDSRRAA